MISGREPPRSKRDGQSWRALQNITVGTRVAIGSEAQPKYLRGMTGEVHEIDGNTVVVCLGAPVGKFKSGHVRCPAELLVPLKT
jgi:hypothetical protein